MQEKNFVSVSSFSPRSCLIEFNHNMKFLEYIFIGRG